MNGYRGVLQGSRNVIFGHLRGTVAKLWRRIPAFTALRVSAALVFGLLSFPAHGQVADGLVGGVARDSSSGSPVAKVQVVAHNLSQGTDQTTTTDAYGMFRFTGLEPGRYDIAATKPGFAKASTTVDVESHLTTRVDIPLKVAADSTATTEKSDYAPMTDREKQLQDEIDRLNARLAAMDIELAARRELPSVNTADATSPGSLSAQQTTAAVNTPAQGPAAPSAAPDPPASPLPQGLQPPPAAQGPDTVTPFAFGDFSWMNGTGRGSPAFDTSFFTPEIRFDTYITDDFNHPVDHTMGGSSEEFRSGEIQLEQASFGGDFHWNNVRGRILTMFGMFATTTPRNDASAGVGQWDLDDAYRYVSEAYGGYHFDVNHGINIDAGIFVSYIGLFSYYNFDNWAYQPSYVSSNTPWFFNGIRIQWFPTNKLKIEPWIINGWQSYAKYNARLGLGGQVLWRPYEWLAFVFNNYGMGTDTLYDPQVSRIHTDNSFEIRYFNRPDSPGLSKMAMSFTGDLGCEYGGGASCFKNTAGGPKTSFAGWMVYNRFWWGKDHHAITIGGGQMDNPGRYLTLLPPINAASAVTGTPYFTENFGDQAKMWDSTITYNWMPKTWVTWWLEGSYRHSDVPYWTGHGGITPPGGNTGSPASYVCTNGASSAVSSFSPSLGGFAVDNVGNAVSTSCTAQYGAGWTAWAPSLVKDQSLIGGGIMVRF